MFKKDPGFDHWMSIILKFITRQYSGGCSCQPEGESILAPARPDVQVQCVKRSYASPCWCAVLLWQIPTTVCLGAIPPFSFGNKIPLQMNKVASSADKP